MSPPDDPKKPPPRAPTPPFGARTGLGAALRAGGSGGTASPMDDPVHRDLHADVEWRLQQAEKNDAAIEQRLQAGAGALAALKDSVNQISERVKPIPPWMLVSMILALLGVVAGGVATFYSRTDDARREANASQRAVEEKVHQVQLEQTEVKGNLEQIKQSLSRTERFMDELAKQKPSKK